MQGVFSDPLRRLYVVACGATPLGTCRFDEGAAAAVVSITMAPQARGLGLGRRVLLDSIARVRQDGLEVDLNAQIKHGNAASLRLFTSCGFKEVAGEVDGAKTLRLSVAMTPGGGA